MSSLLLTFVYKTMCDAATPSALESLELLDNNLPIIGTPLFLVAVCCSVLQCVAVCCKKLNKKIIPVSVVCYSRMLCVNACVFCSIPLLFACMCMRKTSSPRSIVGRECIQARRFRATLLLRTTCMRSCCTRRISSMAA